MSYFKRGRRELEVLRLLNRCPSQTHAQLRAGCVNPPKSLTFQLARMQTAGWIVLIRDGNQCVYVITETGKEVLVAEKELPHAHHGP